MTEARFDLAVVGGGIVGLAHALAAARRGCRTVVFDRDGQANGASVRNFGFVTVTGQASGATWQRARQARDIWLGVAAAAGVTIVHRGTVLVARTDDGLEIFREFAAGPMGDGCEFLSQAGLAERLPMARRDGARGGLWSPHELRVEPRQAIPALSRYLADAHGVTFVRGAHVRAVEPPAIETSAGRFTAERAVVCPGADLLSLFPDAIARHRPTLCKLHMLRLGPQPAGWRLPATVMTDLSCVRYLGFVDCPHTPALRRRLAATEAATLEHGIHLIVVQSADGSLVIGDSHHYAETPDPFAPDAVDALILRHAHATLDIPNRQVTERWIGIYPSAAETPVIIEAPRPETRLVIVTSGTGMSTAFAIAEEVVADLVGQARAGTAQ